MKTTKLGTDYCPSCDGILDTCTSTDGEEVPSPGDVTLCFYCGEVLQFTDDMSTQILPDVVIDSFDEEQKTYIRRLQNAIKNKT